ncbi:MAG: hypothetical protein LBC26_06320, partial [Oscillospiraceae bacterium]|nr:hypothetical protein [Oscillospiraceae bacterium]
QGGAEASLGEVVGLSPLARSYTFTFNIIDDSPVRLLLLPGANADTSGVRYGAQSAVLDGAVVSGRSVYVTKPVAFTAVLVDYFDNVTSLSFGGEIWGRLDSMPPWAEISYELTVTAVKATITLHDDKSPGDRIQMLSAGPEEIAPGQYQLMLYDHSGRDVTFSDEAGHVGSATAQSSLLDMSPANAAILWWSPGRMTYGGPEPEMDVSRPPDKTVSSDISVGVGFDKPLAEASIRVRRPDGTGYLTDEEAAAYAGLTVGAQNVIVTFLQNAAVELTFWPPNRREAMILLSTDRIDKAPPAVDMTILDDTPASVETKVRFDGFSKPVYIHGPGAAETRLYQPGESVTYAALERGVHRYSFIDESGNVTVKEAEIRAVDTSPPMVLLRGLPDEGAFTAQAELTFEATLNEAGVVRFRGQTYTVRAPDGTGAEDHYTDEECDWVTLRVTDNGYFLLTAEDRAGRTTGVMIPVDCFDRQAPTLRIVPSRIDIAAGTEASEVQRLLAQGVSASDNRSEPDKIAVTNAGLTAEQLAVPGLYAVEYTATDELGNTRKTTRSVRVFDPNTLRVAVNGQITESQETTLLPMGAVALEIRNKALGDREPHKVYIRPGRWTAAQMKGQTEAPAAYTLDAPGYYTVYVVTQSRGTYLTYLYATASS